MKKRALRHLLISLILLVMVSLVKPVSGFSRIDFTGTFRSDFIYWQRGNSKGADFPIETQLKIRSSNYDFRYYADLRFNSGSSGAFQAQLLRAFVKHGGWAIGKIYAKTGIMGIFNPFEYRQELNMTDFNYEKEGRIGVLKHFALGDLSSFKIYVFPDTEIQNTDFGGELVLNIKGYDLGGVYQRTSKRQRYGFFLQGDLLFGIKLSAALEDTRPVINLGLDYSLERWIFAVEYYYSAVKPQSKSEYPILYQPASFFIAGQYVYYQMVYRYDEFMSFESHNFFNLVDGSALFIATVRDTISNGLELSLWCMVPTGQAGDEFSSMGYGDYALLARLEAKF